jgi:hypothetical protein
MVAGNFVATLARAGKRRQEVNRAYGDKTPVNRSYTFNPELLKNKKSREDKRTAHIAVAVAAAV